MLKFLSKKQYVSIIVAAISISGCATRQFAEVPNATPVVPLAGVINTLKCGVSNALASDTLGRTGLLNSTAVVTLDVDIVQGTNASGNISAGIPISVGTVTPSFSASRESTLTNNTTVAFNIELRGNNPTACQAVAGKFQDAGFSTWLGQVVAEIDTSVAGAPYASMQKYTYDSNFVVKKTGKAGLDFAIVPVKLGASFDSSRSDVQHIKIVMDAVHFVGKKKKKTGGGPLFDTPPPAAQNQKTLSQ